jgi:hypothetical protein
LGDPIKGHPLGMWKTGSRLRRITVASGG